MHGSVDRDHRRELIERFALAPDRRVRALSHGNRQKLLLIAAFATRAEVLLLDEPTAGLDPLMERVSRDCVREAGLSAAAAAGADEFTTREPSLEELFPAHYGSEVG